MTAALLSVLTQYRAWYESKLGSAQPDWYVFPLSNRIKPVDPTRPVTSLKQAWRVFARLQRLAAACMIGGIRSAQNLLKPESLKAPCLILWETHERQDVAAILPQSSQGPPRSYCGNRSSGFTSGPPRSPQSERTGARRIRRNSLKGRVAQRIEHLPSKQRVAGSSPAAPTNLPSCKLFSTNSLSRNGPLRFRRKCVQKRRRCSLFQPANNQITTRTRNALGSGIRGRGGAWTSSPPPPRKTRAGYKLTLTTSYEPHQVEPGPRRGPPTVENQTSAVRPRQQYRGSSDPRQAGPASSLYGFFNGSCSAGPPKSTAAISPRE